MLGFIIFLKLCLKSFIPSCCLSLLLNQLLPPNILSKFGRSIWISQMVTNIHKFVMRKECAATYLWGYDTDDLELQKRNAILYSKSHVTCALAACPCGTVTSREAVRRMRTAAHGHPHLWAINWAG